MKGTEQFQEAIKSYLDKRAQEDELFRAKYENWCKPRAESSSLELCQGAAQFRQGQNTTRTIEDVCNYIICEVQKSGRCGFSDMEIFSLAVHAVDETDLEIGEHKQCSIVVNTHIDLTEEEKAEQKAQALRRYQDEELRKLQERNTRRAAKQQENKQPEPSLFDF